MGTNRRRLHSVLPWIVTLTYLSLVVWMHIWTLQAGLPQPGEQPSTSHHQVCTWMGTSGEAGLVSCGSITPSQPVAWFTSPGLPVHPVRPVSPSAFPPRAPPVPLLVSASV